MVVYNRSDVQDIEGFIYAYDDSSLFTYKCFESYKTVSEATLQVMNIYICLLRRVRCHTEVPKAYGKIAVRWL